MFTQGPGVREGGGEIVKFYHSCTSPFVKKREERVSMSMGHLSG